MSKAILTFDLAEPEDRQDHLRAVKSFDMCLVLFGMDQWLRSRVKYGGEDISDGGRLQLDKAREHLRALMLDHGIDLDEMLS